MGRGVWLVMYGERGLGGNYGERGMDGRYGERGMHGRLLGERYRW